MSPGSPASAVAPSPPTQPAQPPRLSVSYVPTARLREYGHNPRRNDHAVERQAELIKLYGFRAPLLVRVNNDHEVCDGHLRLKAARQLGLAEVPIADVSDLSDAEVKALRLAMNKSAEWAEWDAAMLTVELRELMEMGVGVDLAGFSEEEAAKLLGPNEDIGKNASNGNDCRVYAVVIECKDEAEQTARLAELLERGVPCRALM